MKSAASDSRTKNTQQPPQPAPVSRAPSAPHFCERKCERRQPRIRQVSSTQCDRHSIFCGAPCGWRGASARHGLAAGRLSTGAAHSLRVGSTLPSPLQPNLTLAASTSCSGSGTVYLYCLKQLARPASIRAPNPLQTTSPWQPPPAAPAREHCTRTAWSSSHGWHPSEPPAPWPCPQRPGQRVHTLP